MGTPAALVSWSSYSRWKSPSSALYQRGVETTDSMTGVRFDSDRVARHGDAAAAGGIEGTAIVANVRAASTTPSARTASRETGAKPKERIESKYMAPNAHLGEMP